MANTLSLELNIVADTDNKQLLKARVPMAVLSQVRIQHGDAGVQQYLFNVFNRLAEDLKKAPQQ